jgi:hypothetical protein
MKIHHRLSLVSLLLTVLALAACGGGTEPAEPPPPEPAPPPPPAMSETRWEKDGLTVTAMTGSPEFPSATLTLDGLEDGTNLPAGPYSFDFGVQGFDLGVQTPDAETKGIANSADGQHIHLILNNQPYTAHYGASFEHELEAGNYVLLAFLSRSYHESVKSPDASLVRHFTVGDAAAEEVDLSAPHLFFSRPKGAYSHDDSQKLMLDFYLVNTDLAPDGNRVRATVNGTELIFTEWVPYAIEGLAPGEVEISLELQDAEGNFIPGPFNSVTRTVTLEAPDEENAM